MEKTSLQLRQVISSVHNLPYFPVWPVNWNDTAIFPACVDWWDHDQPQSLFCALKLLPVILAFAGLLHGCHSLETVWAFLSFIILVWEAMEKGQAQAQFVAYFLAPSECEKIFLSSLGNILRPLMLHSSWVYPQQTFSQSCSKSFNFYGSIFPNQEI